MTPRKIMVVPCIVNSWLYVSALTRCRFGPPSCARIITASRPPTTKKKSDVKR
jgi:hypothetical protein